MDPPPNPRNPSLSPPTRTTVPYALQHSPSPSPALKSVPVSHNVPQQQQSSTTHPRRASRTASSQRVASGSGAGPGDVDMSPVSHSASAGNLSDPLKEKEEVRRLAQRLATRLQYAAFKVERGWTKHSLPEVENLYWRASKARSNGPPAVATASSAFPSSSSGPRNSFKESLEMAQNRRRISQPKASSHRENNGSTTAGALLPGFSYPNEATSRPQAQSHRPTPPIVIRRSSSQHQPQYGPSVNVRIKRYSPELARHLQHQKRRRTHSRQGDNSAEEDALADDEEDDIFGGRPNIPPQDAQSSPESNYTQLPEEYRTHHGHTNGSDVPKTARKVSGGSVLGPAGVPTPPPSAGTIDESSRSGSGASTSLSLLRNNNPSHLRASPTRNTHAHAHAHAHSQSRGQTPSSASRQGVHHVLQAGPSPFTSTGTGARSDSARATHGASSPPTYADFWSKLASGPTGPSVPSPIRASASPEKSSSARVEEVDRLEGDERRGGAGADEHHQTRSQSVDGVGGAAR